MIYKKNTVILFLTIFCLQHPLNSMLGRYGSYIAKNLPHVAAFLKNRLTKATPTVPAGHIIYNTDGSVVTENQFNEIKDDILRPNEFPTALKNPNYNPEADETKVVQEKLDEKYNQDTLRQHFVDPFSEHSLSEPKKTLIQWIPDTLHDLFRYKYSQTQYDEYMINQKISSYLIQNPKKTEESDNSYYQRIAEPLIDFCTKNILNEYKRFFKGYEEIALKKPIKNTITIELNEHTNNPTHALLYRGNGSDKDFDEEDAYDIGKNGQNAKCVKNVATNSSEMLSYGISLLSNSKQGGGGSPFFYTFRHHKPKDPHVPSTEVEWIPGADLQITPIPKKDFLENKSRWFVNSQYDNHQSFHEYGVKFHPRRKSFTTANNLLNKPYVEDGFKIGDPRIREHKTIDEACNDYKMAKEYQVQNTIGVTDYTKNKIKNAQDALEKGKNDRNKPASWMGYFYSFLGYKNK